MAAPLDTHRLALVFDSRPDILAGIQQAAGMSKLLLLACFPESDLTTCVEEKDGAMIAHALSL